MGFVFLFHINWKKFFFFVGGRGALTKRTLPPKILGRAETPILNSFRTYYFSSKKKPLEILCSPPRPPPTGLLRTPTLSVFSLRIWFLLFPRKRLNPLIFEGCFCNGLFKKSFFASNFKLGRKGGGGQIFPQPPIQSFQPPQ